MENLRWKQRFQNLKKALSQLQDAVELAEERPLSKLEELGLIQAFEFTHELAWKVMKDYFIHQGDTSITGSRDATRAAFANGLVSDGEGWMEMIKSRNQTSHTYEEATASEIAEKVLNHYFELFSAFSETMENQ
jgi:nucleotidyltransferase substrate binding protein (TIGR01987 family)